MSAFSTAAVAITAPAGMQAINTARTRYIRAADAGFETNLFSALQMACQLKSARLASLIYSVATDPNHSVYAGIRYPNSSKSRYTVRSNGRRYKVVYGENTREVKYIDGWFLLTGTGEDVSSGDLSGYTRRRKFVVKNTKRRFSDEGTHPIAKYLEFGGAHSPANRGRYILQRAVNYSLAQLRYNISAPGGYGVRALSPPGSTGYGR